MGRLQLVEISNHHDFQTFKKQKHHPHADGVHGIEGEPWLLPQIFGT